MDGHEAGGCITLITLHQCVHVLKGLRRREHRQPLAQCPNSVHPSARSGDSAERIVQIVHRSAHRQPTYPGHIVVLPRSGSRGDDADLVESSVDAVHQVRPIADQRVLRVPSACELLGLPGDDPHQLVFLDTDHSHLTASALTARHC